MDSPKEIAFAASSSSFKVLKAKLISTIKGGIANSNWHILVLDLVGISGRRNIICAEVS